LAFVVNKYHEKQIFFAKMGFFTLFFYFYNLIPYMQESLSNAEYYTPQRQEFDFESYDSEPNPEDSFEKAETLTLQAISSASATS